MSGTFNVIRKQRRPLTLNFLPCNFPPCNFPGKKRKKKERKVENRAMIKKDYGP